MVTGNTIFNQQKDMIFFSGSVTTLYTLCIKGLTQLRLTKKQVEADLVADYKFLMLFKLFKVLLIISTLHRSIMALFLALLGRAQ